MKKEKCWKSLHGCLCAAVLALFTFGFTSCKDDDEPNGGGGTAGNSAISELAVTPNADVSWLW